MKVSVPERKRISGIWWTGGNGGGGQGGVSGRDFSALAVWTPCPVQPASHQPSEKLNQSASCSSGAVSHELERLTRAQCTLAHCSG